MTIDLSLDSRLFIRNELDAGVQELDLLVHEKPDNPCSERLGLVKLFADHGIELKEWTKDRSGLIF